MRRLLVAEGLKDFSSNDYFGLSRSPQIRQRLIAELAAGCPLGATGSRLLSGNTSQHERVEAYLAQAFRAPAVLLFSSGFLANLGVTSVLANLGAEFFSDSLNHASLVDGIRLTRARKNIFKHNDLCHLETQLQQSVSPVKVIITESVFSMNGDLAPLVEICQLAERYAAWLFIDEAHATGVFGCGRLQGLTFDNARTVCVHAGGKALGAQGAFVIASREFKELLVNQARTFIFSTALAPLSALQIEFALQEILSKPQMGADLLQKAQNWRQQLAKAWQADLSQSQIIPIILGENERALQAAAHLREQGYDVRAIRSPTVPMGTERLRITLKSFHNQKDFDELAALLQEVMA